MISQITATVLGIMGGSSEESFSNIDHYIADSADCSPTTDLFNQTTKYLDCFEIIADWLINLIRFYLC